jgi:hypothetical protein
VSRVGGFNIDEEDADEDSPIRPGERGIVDVRGKDSIGGALGLALGLLQFRSPAWLR